MNIFSEIISIIPLAAWTAIIAALATLGGVFLSNLSNNKRLKLQLDHDAREKDKDRTLSLRRDIYTKAVDSVALASRFLGSLANIDLTKTNIADGLGDLLAVAAKVHISGSASTFKATSKLVSAYQEILLKASPTLVSLQRLRSEIETADKQFAISSEDVSRVLNEMKRFNEAGKVDQNSFSALQRSFESHQKFFVEYTARQVKLRIAFFNATVDLSRELIAHRERLTVLQVDFLASIRQDMGLEANTEDLRQEAELQFSQLKAALDVALEQMRNMTKEMELELKDFEQPATEIGKT